MNGLFTVSLICIVFIIGNICGCSSVGVTKSNIRHDYTDTSDIQLDNLKVDNLDSYYTIENGKFYSRIYYKEQTGSYNFVIYFVADIKNGRLMNSSAYIVDATIHPLVLEYQASTRVATLEEIDNISSLSLKLLAKNILQYKVKSVAIMLDHVPLEYLNTLSDLKSLDKSWMFAKNARKMNFKAY